jgi:hypothetical protein
MKHPVSFFSDMAKKSTFGIVRSYSTPGGTDHHHGVACPKGIDPDVLERADARRFKRVVDADPTGRVRHDRDACDPGP